MKPPLLRSARVLALILKELGEHASVRHAWVLLQVASAEPQGLDQREIVQGIGTAAASRISRALSAVGWRRAETGDRVPDAGLIDSHPEPNDLRLRCLTLTPTGRSLIARIDEAAA